MLVYPFEFTYLFKFPYRSSIIILLVIVVTAVDAQKTIEPKPNKEYNEAIVIADKHLLAGDYLHALNDYERAWDLYPRQKYPEKKIDQINRILADTALSKLMYFKSINQGDSSFLKKDYRGANTEYYLALRINPDAQYPKARLSEISKLYSDPESETRYRIILIHAGKSFNKGNYDQAIGFYMQALIMKPSEEWLNQRIEDVIRQKEKNASGMDTYTKCLLESDNLMEKQKWPEARSGYANALTLRPNEIYPAARIVFIDHLLTLNKGGQQTYSILIDEADKFYKVKDYENAAIHYEKALDLKPGDPYPKSMLKKLSHGKVQGDVMAQTYDAAVMNADILSVAGDLEAALIGYQRCIGRVPGDDYVMSRINELSNVSKEHQESQHAYQAAVANGDKSLASSNYTKALSEYRYAAKIKPDESYPKVKIEETQKLISMEKTTAVKINKVNVSPGEPQTKKDSSVLVTNNRSVITMLAVSDDKINTDNDYTTASAVKMPAMDTKPVDTYLVENAIAKPVLNQQNANQENYDKAIAFADKAFNEKNYLPAINGYKAAVKYKPEENYPKERIASINSLLGQTKVQEDKYQKAITTADQAFSQKDYSMAVLGYQAALEAKHGEVYPKQRIAAINVILGQQKARQDRYDNAIIAADKAFNEKEYIVAVKEYKSALGLLPDESYPNERIEAINTLLNRQKVAQEQYSKAIVSAEKAFAAKDYSSAIYGYQSALEYKPDEAYPRERITVINGIIALDREKLDRQYADYISQADALYSRLDLLVAQKAYKMALMLKPGEKYPKERYDELSAILIAKAKAVKDSYDQAIAEADKAYKSMIFDQAVKFYLSALEVKPGEPYPGQMIARIRKYMIENAVVDVTSGSFILKNNTEKRFRFKPVDASLRKNNYLVVRARTSGNMQPKLFLDYGSDDSKNGGIVLKNFDSGILSDFVINISVQDKWFREDNNWLSLYSENGDIEVSSVRISQGK